MLIYNYKKEFLGIDEHDLATLGFATLNELNEEATDFADLFVKEPGFVHKFKYVHWIDFVNCNDSSEGSKVIIKTSSKSFKSNVEVKTVYLADNPDEKAYLVFLLNLRELINGELSRINEPVIAHERAETKTELKTETTIETPKVTNIIQEPKYENSVTKSFTEPSVVTENIELFEEAKIEKPFKPEPKIEVVQTLVKEDALLHVHLDEEEFEEVEEEIEVEIEVDDESKDEYTYDPNVASSELGLPVDLIEDFIQDFIEQAKEFKSKLYNAYETGDTANVKSLSHKLKGVATNLRIEDALETLTIINTSTNPAEIKSNLDTFYLIIAKYSGEKVSAPKKIIKSKKIIKKRVPKKASVQQPIQNYDNIEIGFKEEESIAIPQTDTPQKVASQDDDFVVSFKDDEDLAPMATVSAKEPKTESDDFVISLKDDIQSDGKAMHIASDEEENITLDFDENDIKIELTQEPKIELNDNITIPKSVISASQEIEVMYKKQKAADEIGLDNESFNELFEDYISEAKSLSDEITHAVESNNASVWQSNAVKLKGMGDKYEDI